MHHTMIILSRHRRWIAAYSVIAISAIALDQHTDQSGGALSLAALLKFFFAHWILSAVLVLLGFFAARSTQKERPIAED